MNMNIEEINKTMTPPGNLDSCKEDYMTGDEILEKFFGDNIYNIPNPIFDKSSIKPNGYYRVYMRETNRGTVYLDWIKPFSELDWLRHYITPQGKAKELVSKIMTAYLADPDYPMDQFIYDLIKYGESQMDSRK